jgi:tetratricopeptide (TPR) repeat protein
MTMDTDLNKGEFIAKICGTEDTPSDKLIDAIYDAITNNDVDDDHNDKEYYLWLGWYAMEKKDTEGVEKYFHKVIELGNDGGYSWIGDHYKFLPDYDKMKKYYKLGIDKKDDRAANNLASYYYDIKYLKTCEKEDCDEAIKYYKLAIKLGHGLSQSNLARIYKDLMQYKKAIHYYEMCDCRFCWHDLMHIYKRLGDHEKVYYYKIKSYYDAKDKELNGDELWGPDGIYDCQNVLKGLCEYICERGKTTIERFKKEYPDIINDLKEAKKKTKVNILLFTIGDLILRN